MNGIYRLSPLGSLPVFAIIALIVLIVLVVPLLILGLIGAAFSRLGFSWIEAVAVILLMFLGSFVNIPLWTFQRREANTGTGTPAVFDAFTGEPVPDERLTTELSINIGGAVIPLIVSGFLLVEVQRLTGESLLLQAGIALLIVALITRVLTTIIPGYGIRAPLFVPAVSALALGLLLTGGTGLSAAVVAFAGGTAGIVLGAGVCTLPAIKNSSVSRVSIGGAGMFGAVFLCGLLAALIA
jgi:uncharacterized membrane protein